MKKFLFLCLSLVSLLSFAGGVGYNPEQAAQFEKTNQCIGCDLTGYRTKQNPNHSRAVLKNSNLSGATIGNGSENWRGSDFSNTTVGNGAQLSNADFTNSNFSEIKILNSVLAGNYTNGIFTNALIQSSQLDGFFPNSSFSGAKILSSKLSGTYINGIFKGATITDSIFMGRGSGANFSSSYIRNSGFFMGDTNDADFSNADIDHLSIGEDVKMCAKCNFSGARVTNSMFNDVFFDASKFVNATINNTNFTGAYLEGSDFTGANLTGANFTGTILTKANFCNAKVAPEQLARASNLSCAIKPDCVSRYPNQNGNHC